MHISSVTFENIKAWRDETEIRFKPGINFFVGNNNCGKSTVFEALLFFLNGKAVPAPAVDPEAHQTVSVTLSGDRLPELTSEGALAKVRPFVHKVEGAQTLRLQRSTELKMVIQNGAEVQHDVKKIVVWNDEIDRYENATGIDAAYKRLLDIEAIWADALPKDVADLGSTKVLGRLLRVASRGFFDSEQWAAFERAHNEAFTAEENSLAAESAAIAQDLSDIVTDQFGKSAIRFDFSLPDPDTFLKAAGLAVDDGSADTPMSQKGTGLQRATMLAIVQLWAKYSSKDRDPAPPLILLIDEPETWLHPMAQRRLAAALDELAESQQIFVITHSPYILGAFREERDEILVFKNDGGSRSIETHEAIALRASTKPTLAEISYQAFEIISDELHNELYGYLVEHLTSKNGGKDANVKMVDAHLAKSTPSDRTWKRTDGKSDPATLPVYIRNSFHHPENTLNAPYSQDELEASTAILVDVLRSEGVIRQLPPTDPPEQGPPIG